MKYLLSLSILAGILLITPYESYAQCMRTKTLATRANICEVNPSEYSNQGYFCDIRELIGTGSCLLLSQVEGTNGCEIDGHTRVLTKMESQDFLITASYIFPGEVCDQEPGGGEPGEPGGGIDPKDLKELKASITALGEKIEELALIFASMAGHIMAVLLVYLTIRTFWEMVK